MNKLLRFFSNVPKPELSHVQPVQFDIGINKRLLILTYLLTNLLISYVAHRDTDIKFLCGPL